MMAPQARRCCTVGCLNLFDFLCFSVCFLVCFRSRDHHACPLLPPPLRPIDLGDEISFTSSVGYEPSVSFGPGAGAGGGAGSTVGTPASSFRPQRDAVAVSTPLSGDGGVNQRPGSGHFPPRRSLGATFDMADSLTASMLEPAGSKASGRSVTFASLPARPGSGVTSVVPASASPAVAGLNSSGTVVSTTVRSSWPSSTLPLYASLGGSGVSGGTPPVLHLTPPPFFPARLPPGDGSGRRRHHHHHHSHHRHHHSHHHRSRRRERRASLGSASSEPPPSPRHRRRSLDVEGEWLA